MTKIKRTRYLEAGPFTVAFSCEETRFARDFALLYAYHQVSDQPRFADFHIRLHRPFNLHRLYRPQIDFLLDGRSVFNPLPLTQVLPIFEWGLNWAIGNRCNFYLVIHAAVLEKQGQGLLMPGAPGSGKSTLCAALALSGWRLLSDELALIDPADGLCHPLPRPVSLKDASIDIIRGLSDQALLSPTVHDTQKGSVAYLRPPEASVREQRRPVPLRTVVFPKFQKEREGYQLTPASRAYALVKIAEQSFNYHLFGLKGFKLLQALVEPCQVYDFHYDGDLATAIDVLERHHGQ